MLGDEMYPGTMKKKKSRVLLINRGIEKYIIPIIKESSNNQDIIYRHRKVKNDEIENCINIIKKRDLERYFPCIKIHKKIDTNIKLATYIGNSKYEGISGNTKDNLKDILDLVEEPRIRVMFIYEFTDNVQEAYCVCHDYSLKMIAYDLYLFSRSVLSKSTLCLIKEICKNIHSVDLNDYSEIDKMIDDMISKYCEDISSPIKKIINVILHFMVLYFYSLDNAVLRREGKLVDTKYGRITDVVGLILMFEGIVTADNIASQTVLNNYRKLADEMLRNIILNKNDERMQKIIIHKSGIKKQKVLYKDISSAWES